MLTWQTFSTLHHKYDNLCCEHFSSLVSVKFGILQWSRHCDSTSWMGIGIASSKWNYLFPFAQNSMQVIAFTIVSMKFISLLLYIYKKTLKDVCTDIKGRLRQLVSVGTTDEIIWVGLKPILSNSQPAQLKTKPTWAAVAMLVICRVWEQK